MKVSENFVKDVIDALRIGQYGSSFSSILLGINTNIPLGYLLAPIFGMTFLLIIVHVWYTRSQILRCMLSEKLDIKLDNNGQVEYIGSVVRDPAGVYSGIEYKTTTRWITSDPN